MASQIETNPGAEASSQQKKETMRNLLLLLLGFSSARWACSQTIMLEEEGVVMFDVESTPPDGVGFAQKTEIEGYTGSGYYEALEDSRSGPGVGVLEYKFRIQTAGIYQMQLRSFIALGRDLDRPYYGESNDSWARLVDSSGIPVLSVPNMNQNITDIWYKVFFNKNHVWQWNLSNREEEPKSLAWDLQAGQNYTLELSNQSKGHAIDRIFFWKRGDGHPEYADPETGLVHYDHEDMELDYMPASLPVDIVSEL